MKREEDSFRVESAIFLLIDISIEINKRYEQQTSFYHKAFELLSINLQHAALSTHYTHRFSKLYIRAVGARLFHLLRNIFLPYNQLHVRSYEGNSCLPVKVKTVTCEKVELSRPTFSFHSEKRRQSTNTAIFT